MKGLLFTKDLLEVFRNDNHYGVPSHLVVALRKVGISSFETSNDTSKMFNALAVHIMDQRGESEPFLSEAFIEPESVIKFLKEHGLPAPTMLQPPKTTRNGSKESIDPARFEQYFDVVCRNCGTVTDPLAKNYRTPIGRLIFKTFLETRLTLGINATGRYVLEHMKNYDTDHIVSTINEDSVIWKVDETREKIMSVETIGKFVLSFNRELKSLL